MSIWNPDNIRDVAESVGILNLQEDVLQTLSSDVEYRLSQLLEEALDFMRHSRRNNIGTRDVAQALRALQVEPLYGYESTRPLRFGEASLGPGQPLFYVEDEEVDLEKLINAPLPKVPREVAQTAHWLSVEGVQPSIPQNPTTAESRVQEMMPKGASANPHLSAISGIDSAVGKTQVKHVVAKELLLYFERVCSGLLDETSDDFRQSALSSVAHDPGLQQLMPYFVHFVAEKVTHCMKSLFVLQRILDLVGALLQNDTIFLDPYVMYLTAPVLTCAIARHIGSSSNQLESYPVRSHAASLLGRIAKKYARSSHTMKPRLARMCLKQFLDPKNSFQSHYGAIMVLQAIANQEGIRVLVLPNLKEYGKLLQDGMDAGSPIRHDAEMVVGAVLESLKRLEDEGGPLTNGYASGDTPDHRARLETKVGPFLADRIIREGRPQLIQAVLET